MTRLDADWLNAEATQTVFALLQDAGHQVYAVGGCVRDAVLGRSVSDIDLSTSARPDVVVALAETAGLRVIPTGLEHGTVTVVIGDMPFEITTFRRDVETDGRRAVVDFSDKIEEDALRRDFTMNALYCDPRGLIADPMGGLADLNSGRVRFIEDAETRIREDYLRSLRYFRFHAWYGDPDKGFDPDALDAIARNVDGLAFLSHERVGAEVKRLLLAPDPAPSVAAMRTAGVLSAILPGADDTGLAPLVAFESEVGAEPDAMRRLAVLGGADVANLLRLSRREAERLRDIRRSVGKTASELGYRLGAAIGRDVLLVSAALFGVPVATEDLVEVATAADQEFPVKAADLMPEYTGPLLGARIKQLEKAWIESGFHLDRDALMALEG